MVLTLGLELLILFSSSRPLKVGILKSEITSA